MSGSRRTAPLPPEWPQIRQLVLMRDRSRCLYGLLDSEEFEVGECPVTATEVDHMGDPSDHDLAKLRAICHQHHLRRTSKQGNDARREKLRAQKGRFRSAPRSKPHPGLRD